MRARSSSSPRCSPPTSSRLVAAALWLARGPRLRARAADGAPAVEPLVARQRPRRRHRALLGGGAVLGAVAVGATMLVGPSLPGYAARRRSSTSIPTRGGLPPDRQPPRRDPGPAARAVRHRVVQRDDEPARRTGGSPPSTSSTATCGRRGARSAAPRASSTGCRRRARRRRRGHPEHRDHGPGGHLGPGRIRDLAAIEPGERRRPVGARVLDADRRRPSTRRPTGSIYDVTSAVPTYEPDALRAADGHIARARPIAQHRPADRVPAARRRRGPPDVAAGATTPYDQARALQDYFRDGSFTYSLVGAVGSLRHGHRVVPVRHPHGLLRAVRRHVRGDGTGRSACRLGSPSGSRPASRTRSTRSGTSSGASTPTPGPRCTSPASAGSPSSRRRGAARPARRATPACPSPRTRRERPPSRPSAATRGRSSRPSRRRRGPRRRRFDDDAAGPSGLAAGAAGAARPSTRASTGATSCATWGGSSSASSALAVLVVAIGVRRRRDACRCGGCGGALRATTRRGQGAGGVGRGRRVGRGPRHDARRHETPLEFARRMRQPLIGDGRPATAGPGRRAGRLRRRRASPTRRRTQRCELSHGIVAAVHHQTTRRPAPARRRRSPAARAPRPPPRPPAHRTADPDPRPRRAEALRPRTRTAATGLRRA